MRSLANMFLPIEVALMILSGTAPFRYNITGMWRVRIVGAMVCIPFLGMGLVSAWACMIAHNMLLFCLTFIRGGWNPLNAEES